MGDRIEQFLLSITPIGPSDRPEEKFWVRTERVPKGVPLAEEVVVWQLDHWIDQAQMLAGDPLVALLNPQGAASQSPLAFGQLLYGEVFKGRIRDSWLVAQGVAQSQQQILQFRLGLKGDRLPRLPWEALSGDGRTLTTGTEVTFSRFRSQFEHQATPREDINQLRFPNRLRILIAVSEPDDRDRLELAQEVERLQGELAKLRDLDSPLDIVIEVLQQPDREQLTQALEQGNYQIFHYAGHSTSGPDGGNLHLVSRRTGLAEMLSGQDLAGLLVNNGVLLAFFNSCQGSYTAAGATPPSLLAKDTAVIDNLAAALVERGVPGVLAMSESIPDDVALTLMQLFYRNLRPDYSIDLSLSRVRQGLVSAYGSDRFYWALPILYLHRDFDGYLFRPNLVQLPGQGTGGELLPLENDEDIREDLGSATPSVDPKSQPMPQPVSQSASQSITQDRDRPPLLASDATPAKAGGKVGGLVDIPAFLRQSLTPTPAAAPPATTTRGEPVAGVPTPAPAPRFKPPVPWVVGGLAIAAIGAGSLLWNPGDPDPTPSPSAPAQTAQVPTTAQCTEAALLDLGEGIPPDNLVTLGIDCVNQGNPTGALAPLSALLDNNALVQANELLQSIPTDDQTADYYFAKGRLAWQATKTGQAQALAVSVNDAVRDWDEAAKRDPSSVVYRTALGFAYYQISEINLAQTAWTEALAAIADGGESNAIAQVVPPQTPAEKQRQRAILDARAGLALISYGKWISPLEPEDQKPGHLANFQNQLDIIRARDGSNFAPSQLGNHWLWTPTTVNEWAQIYAPASPFPQASP